MLRDEWKFEGYITSDSDSCNDVYSQHHYTKTAEEAVAACLHGGTGKPFPPFCDVVVFLFTQFEENLLCLSEIVAGLCLAFPIPCSLSTLIFVPPHILDIDSGSTYTQHLAPSVSQGESTRAMVDQALTNSYVLPSLNVLCFAC